MIPSITTLFLLITCFALIAGVLLMVMGGKLNRKYANRLMVARVAFQAITIGFVCLLVYLRKS